ncbi:MAG: RNA polymerase factor sigma-54 [Proteobacteria bacterium]|jgi:RNA polymerase sigma-54 factor|nr:RNA polymerase factor sigma-54 [Desulfocapsa sp.]MBU3944882.1 RNA polymerase factor sigma-54 [Pseudomonadota bacterium]MCG2744917.1 RNA polymerase factor sigma-54 [Desulfobacteraceae bacterium]MBU3981890.1 RNA polymerase factor sigma-54 [Pseudomonadota bacterium]MBU4027528.1 RNA polymerase factor sigma-54 [Pseudomonadota bacterium]
MALELRQQLKLSQKLVMTQQLRQAIKLLQLNRLELSNALQAELEQNPALEEDFSLQEEISNPQSLTAVEEAQGSGQETDFTAPVTASDTIPETNWEDYANNFDDNFSFSHETPAADAPSQFDFISQKPGLSAYLQWQLAHSNLDSEGWDVALFIVGNLNRYGFLEVDLPEVMAETGCDQDTAEYILEVIQDLDPPGIAARNVSESLFLQLERKGMGDSLAAEIALHHLNHLQTGNHAAIARATGRKKPEVVKAIHFITTELSPYPGLPYAEESTNYIVPDIYVKKIDGEYVVRLNDDDLPNLKLSSHYQELLQNSGDIEKNSRAYLKEKLKDAEWFLKSIQQRQRTILKTMESILRFQHDFFEYGPTRLKPLILRDVAEDIEMHESTISRVTSNKYVHTPQGIYELKYFFSTSIPREGADPLAAESIRERIRQLIRDEDPRKPLSDDALSKKLAETNVQIARRTVAKYREQMKILPVKHRRKS